MPAELATVRGSEDYRLTYRRWPAPGAPRATLVLFNGVMSHSGWFEPLAEPLARAGIKVVGADRRGSGKNSAARGDAPSARALLEDARAIVEAEHDGQSPLFVAGWCWGAILAINLAAELGPKVRGLMLLAPGMYPTETLVERMKATVAAQSNPAEDEPVLESPIDEAMFTRGPALESFILTDGERLPRFTPRFASVMARLGLGASTKLPRLGVPVLLILARDDRATDNEKTRTGLAKIPNLRTVEVPGEHGLQFEAPERVAEELRAFVDEVSRVRSP